MTNTRDEIIARGREIGRARWGKPLPDKAVKLLRLYADQPEDATEDQKKAAS